MEEKHYDLNNYKLHMYKTDKFKKTTIRISFKRNVVKEEITIRSMICHLLVLSCQKYPSERLLAKKMETLYGSTIMNNSNRTGQITTLTIDLTMLNDIYTEDNNSTECLKLLKEIIFNPNANDEGFDSNSFELAKKEMASELKLEKEYTVGYSLTRLLENMDSTSPISYRYGYLDDLKKMTRRSVYDYYLSMLKNDIVDVYVIGNIDFDDMKEKILKTLPFENNNIKSNQVFVLHQSFNNIVKEVREEDNVNQSVMMIGCKIKDLTNFEYQYVMPLYDNILGGASSSKVFQSVREKNSLAYHASSIYKCADNLLVIWAGINKNNYDQVLKLIIEAMNSMNTNEVTLKELNTAKSHFIRNLSTINDSPQNIITDAIKVENYSLDNILERQKNIDLVTIEDINNISKKIIIDTSYMLHGGE